MERGYIKGLDGLRALAVLLVFAEHRIWVGSWMNLGRLGVETFFVLSGFLIVGILARRRALIDEGRARAWPEIRTFFLHRSFRIFPAYYLMLGVVAVWMLGPWEAWPRFDYFGYYVTYTTNLALGYLYGVYPPGIIGHAWTLAIEEQFYLIAAPLFLLVPRRWGVAVCVGVIALALAATIVLLALGHSDFTVGMDSMVNFGFLGVGGLLAQTVAPAEGRSNVRAVIAAALCVPIAAYSLFHHPLEGRANEVIWFVMGLIATLMVTQIVRNQASRVVTLLEFEPLKRLGRISYGFYLYHLFIEFPAIGPGIKNIYPLTVALDFAASFVAASLSWALIEKPVLAWRDRLLRPRGDGAAAPMLPSMADQNEAAEPGPEGGTLIAAPSSGRNSAGS